MKQLLLSVIAVLSAACASERAMAPAPTSPLVIVDGKEMPDATTQSLKALEIEKVEVIKGPVAQTKYGPRALNGVILVKTRAPSR